MTVPGHQKQTAGAGACPDGAEHSRGASVYEKMRFFASVELRGSVLSLFQDPFGVMQIVEAVDFREIDGGGIAQKGGAAFVPRHMKGISVGGGIGFQFVVDCHNRTIVSYETYDQNCLYKIISPVIMVTIRQDCGSAKRGAIRNRL